MRRNSQANTWTAHTYLLDSLEICCFCAKDEHIDLSLLVSSLTHYAFMSNMSWLKCPQGTVNWFHYSCRKVFLFPPTPPLWMLWHFVPVTMFRPYKEGASSRSPGGSFSFSYSLQIQITPQPRTWSWKSTVSHIHGELIIHETRTSCHCAISFLFFLTYGTHLQRLPHIEFFKVKIKCCYSGKHFKNLWGCNNTTHVSVKAAK